MRDEYISSLGGVQMDAALMDMAQHISEAWAIGTRNGADVDSSDETYKNNAKYYAEIAEEAIGGVEQYAESAAASANAASASAYTATFQASAASASAQEASAYADEIKDLTLSASTGAPGSSAAVTKTKVNNVYNLAFSIPRGDKGEKGDKGDVGPRGASGGVAMVDSVTPGSNGNVLLSALRFVAQTLTDAQKTQARANIGAGTSSLTIGTTASTAAAGNHKHSAGDITSGSLTVSNGGTGATTAANARTNLGLGDAAVKSATTAVTNGSAALVTSGGVYSAIDTIKNGITIDFITKTGTGTNCTADSPNSITFPRAPRFIIFLGTIRNTWTASSYPGSSHLDNDYIFVNASHVPTNSFLKGAWGSSSSNARLSGKKSADGKTFYYYYDSTGNNAGASQNDANFTYIYMVIY